MATSEREKVTVDPNANLQEQLELARAFKHEENEPGDAERLAELVLALDE